MMSTYKFYLKKTDFNALGYEPIAIDITDTFDMILLKDMQKHELILKEITEAEADAIWEEIEGGGESCL